MFIRPYYRKKDGKRHAYWALVESYRTDRGPRQRVVAYLGQLEDERRRGVKRAAEGKKNIALVQRTRRENVTEMILEPIKDFIRAPFCEECEGADSMSAAEAVDTARRLEDRAIRYYTEAAAKIKAQPEVARALKLVGKKHTAHLNKLKEM